MRTKESKEYINLGEQYNSKQLIRDARKRDPQLREYNEDLMSKVVRRCFDLMIDKVFLKEGYLDLPHNFGRVILLKRESLKLKNGKPQIPNIDWGATHKLWKDDPSTYKKVYVRHSVSGYIYSLKYIKGKHRHLRWYNIRFSRVLKKRLSDKITQDNIIAYEPQ